jgi:hypothetical protein
MDSHVFPYKKHDLKIELQNNLLIIGRFSGKRRIDIGIQLPEKYKENFDVSSEGSSS